MKVDVTMYFQNLVSKRTPQRGGTNFISRAQRIFSIQTKRAVFKPVIKLCLTKVENFFNEVVVKKA